LRILIDGGARTRPRHLILEAVEWHDLEMVKLLPDGGGPRVLNPPSGEWGPRMRAAACGKLDIAGFLASTGADLNARSRIGGTALMLSVRERRLRMMRFLLESGADPSLPDRDGATALDCSNESPGIAAVLAAAEPKPTRQLVSGGSQRSVPSKTVRPGRAVISATESSRTPSVDAPGSTIATPTRKVPVHPLRPR
jgi:hypothetical protein